MKRASVFSYTLFNCLMQNDNVHLFFGHLYTRSRHNSSIKISMTDSVEICEMRLNLAIIVLLPNRVNILILVNQVHFALD